MNPNEPTILLDLIDGWGDSVRVVCTRKGVTVFEHSYAGLSQTRPWNRLAIYENSVWFPPLVAPIQAARALLFDKPPTTD